MRGNALSTSSPSCASLRSSFKRGRGFYDLLNTVQNMTDARMLRKIKIKESDKFSLILSGCELNIFFIK